MNILLLTVPLALAIPLIIAGGTIGSIYLTRWADRFVQNTQRASEQLDIFDVAANKLLDDDRTPMSVCEFLVDLSSSHAKKPTQHQPDISTVVADAAVMPSDLQSIFAQALAAGTHPSLLRA
jgi:hypothetical protein